MFDTMTLTKVLGGFCGTFLVFLLGGWVAEELYHSGGSEEQAYVIEVFSDEPDDGEAEDAGPPFEEIYAMADPEAGQGLWRACAACHALEPGQNGTGPYLHGVVGRDVASADGFNYSGALVAVADVWTPEELDAFIENPRGYAPGTTMSYNGMRNAQDRANLIAYLDTVDN